MPSTAVSAQSNVLEADLLRCLPHLRIFARYLTKDRSRASDLEQETVAKALKAAHQFQAGTNLKSWMMTIMRNQFYSDIRRNRVQVQIFDEVSETALATGPPQELSLELFDFRRAFWQLDEHHRRVLILVGVGGLTYEIAASAVDCPVGTMKSRVHRARRELRRILAQGSLGAVRPCTPTMARYVSDVLAEADAAMATAGREAKGSGGSRP